MARRLIFSGLIILSTLIVSCRPGSETAARGFYYWKTGFRLTTAERSALSNVNCARLYVRFFDVIWDEALQSPQPAAKLTINDSLPLGITFTPVVYITNEALKKSKDEHISLLAANVRGEINAIAQAAGMRYNEVQIDCDWTENTRDKYFTLLRLIADNLHQQKKIISATIRLHQIKYYERTGVPPVDRGMLMFYNLGKLSVWNPKNSIYDAETAAQYTSRIKSYPLQLDAVLPAFGWVQQIRKGKIIGLLNTGLLDEMPVNTKFENLGSGNYRVTESFFLHGEYLMTDDLLRTEFVKPELCLKAARQLSENLKNERRTVALFDINSLFKLEFNEKDIEKVYRCFN